MEPLVLLVVRPLKALWQHAQAVSAPRPTLFIQGPRARHLQVAVRLALLAQAARPVLAVPLALVLAQAQVLPVQALAPDLVQEVDLAQALVPDQAHRDHLPVALRVRRDRPAHQVVPIPTFANAANSKAGKSALLCGSKMKLRQARPSVRCLQHELHVPDYPHSALRQPHKPSDRNPSADVGK